MTILKHLVRPLRILRGDPLCPLCGNRAQAFFPFGVDARPGAQCPTCKSLERHRLLWLYLKRETALFATVDQKIVHIAPIPGEAAVSEQLDRHFSENYISGDIEPGKAKRVLDLTALDIEDSSVDLLICNHVLEHILDDRTALSEIYRVLRPGGQAILMVPIRTEVTFEDPSITSEEERLRVFGQQDHVRNCGNDYYDRYRDAGFAVDLVQPDTYVSASEIRGMNLAAHEIPVCRKPSL